MSANPPRDEGPEIAQRDRMLRRLIGCFAAAALVAFGLAVTMSIWQQSGGDLAPMALAQDAAF
jgi:hypothetical protein